MLALSRKGIVIHGRNKTLDMFYDNIGPLVRVWRVTLLCLK